MSVKFDSTEKRDALAIRLRDLARHMIASRDQGEHHQIYVNDEMIDDVLAAAAIVHLAEIVQPEQSFSPSADPVQHPWGGAF